MWWGIVLCIGLILGQATPAHAWGPGMHLELAQWCLGHLALAAPAVARLLRKHPRHFIYGSVSPDIFLSKKRAGLLFHCHNWRMGKLLLSEATTDAQRAAVYGYLVHLAADVVAHSYFIPRQIIHSYRARLLGHAYWEMRFDLCVEPATWAVVAAIVRGDYQDFDGLLERVLKKTLFSFKTSRRILKALLVVQRLKRLRNGLHVYAGRSRWSLRTEHVGQWRRLVEKTVAGFLAAPETAPCLQGDPTGLSREVEATRIRRRLRRAWRRREWSEARIGQIVAQCDRRLREAVFDSVVHWPDL